jgi:cellobiose phosphorylase
MPAEPRLDNPYGHFDPDSKAFVITDIFTPKPWANVMSNDDYGLVLSQFGGGFSWAGNCQLFRLSRWEQDLAKDEYGRFLYLFDLDSGDVLSTTYQPTREKGQVDECEHGLGYSIFRRRFRDLTLEHSIHVPLDARCEVWRIVIRNDGIKDRRFRLASYLEWHLGGIGDWHREFHRLFIESRRVGNTLVAWKHSGLEEDKRPDLEPPTYGFMTVNGFNVERWITDKGEFLGRGGGADAPLGPVHDAPPEAGKTPRWDEPIASAIWDVEVPAFEELSFTIVIGAADSVEGAQALGERFHQVEALASLRLTTAHWQKRCAAMNVSSGDADVDFLANSWLPYQTIAGRMYARCAYYQQGGAYGFRDQLQDSLMLLESEPETALLQLGRHAEAMYPSGAVKHWWHPGTAGGPDSRHSDTCLWLAYGTLAYVDATGDTDALGRQLGFLGSEEVGTLWEHCRRGIHRALDRRSPRGLPLLGAGDWNDGLSHAGIDGKGESVWMAMFLFDILKRWAPWRRQLGDAEMAALFEGEAEKLKIAVETHAWDGEYYIAGTRDDGKPFGSKSCTEGKIFLNPQTWSVITGIASPDRQAQAMESVRKHLLTPYGALLLQPAYSQVDNYIGYITRYAPGLRENGGVYSHASTWAIWAFAKIGDHETARGILRGMLPSLRSCDDADLYAAEPYATPGNVDGPDSPYFGRAGWTWYTGSSAWMVRMAKLINNWH